LKFLRIINPRGWGKELMPDLKTPTVRVVLTAGVGAADEKDAE